MKRVICSLPNASSRISGVLFTHDRGQMVSEPVAQDVAAMFEGIPGYTILDDEGDAKDSNQTPKESTEVKPEGTPDDEVASSQPVVEPAPPVKEPETVDAKPEAPRKPGRKAHTAAK